RGLARGVAPGRQGLDVEAAYLEVGVLAEDLGARVVGGLPFARPDLRASLARSATWSSWVWVMKIACRRSPSARMRSSMVPQSAPVSNAAPACARASQTA